MFEIVPVHSMVALEVAYLRLNHVSPFLVFPRRTQQVSVARADNMNFRLPFIIPPAITLVLKNLTNFHTADTLCLRYATAFSCTVVSAVTFDN
jgi:hypothetical protein